MIADWFNINAGRRFPFATGPVPDDAAEHFTDFLGRPGLETPANLCSALGSSVSKIVAGATLWAELSGVTQPVQSLPIEPHGVIPYRNAWIVDAGFTLLPQSGHQVAQHTIQLVLIVYHATTEHVYFEFRSTSPAMACYRFVFAVSIAELLTGTPWSNRTIFATAQTGVCYVPPDVAGPYDATNEPTSARVGAAAYGGTYEPAGVAAPHLGYGFITFGDLAPFFTVIHALMDEACTVFPSPSGGDGPGAMYDLSWIWTGLGGMDPELPIAATFLEMFPTVPYALEPSVIVVLDDVVTQIRIANLSQIAVDEPCVGNGYAVQTEAYAYRTFDGHVRIKPGFNAQINVDQGNNAIEIGAGVGSGVGPACGIYGPYDDAGYGYDIGEGYYAYSSRDCRGLIHTMNGVVPDDAGRFLLIGQNGVVVIGVVDQHRIQIDTTQVNSVNCGG